MLNSFLISFFSGSASHVEDEESGFCSIPRAIFFFEKESTHDVDGDDVDDDDDASSQRKLELMYFFEKRET